MQRPAGKPSKLSRFRKKAMHIAGAALLVCAALTGRADAQSAGEEVYPDPIVVTATRTPERLGDVADSLETFDSERIESLLPGDVIDFLGEAAGVVLPQTNGRGGQTSLFLRGSESNFTSVMLDGFKLTFPDGSAYDFGHLSPEWVGAAEVLKGPQSPLYGSDAAAGVVNLLPDLGKPGEAQQLSVRTRAGGFDTYEETLKIKGGTARSGYVATFSRTDTNGHLPNDGYHRTVGTVGLDHFFSDDAKVRFVFHANRNRYDLPGPDHEGYREPNEYRDSTEQLIGVRAHLRPLPWLEYIPRVSLYLRDARDENKPDALDASFSKTDTEGERIRLDNQFNVRLPGERLGMEGLRASVSTLGVEWEEESYAVKSDSAFGASEYDSTRRAVSVYAQQQLLFRAGFTLAAGVRLDDFDVGEDEVTGKLSASYRIPGTQTRLRGAVGEGIKRPSFSELLDVYGPGNPNLKSEKQKSWEAGFDQFFGKKVKLSGTYYENHVDDLIAYSAVEFANGTNYANIRKARIRGAELALSLIDFHDFTIHARLNAMDTETLDEGGVSGAPNYVKGEDLLRRPTHSWSGSLVYHPGRLRAALRVQTVGKQWDIDDSASWPYPRVENSAYTRVDLALSLEVVQNHVSMLDRTNQSLFRDMTIELKVNNALDEDYESVFGYSAPGVQWFAGLRIVF